MDDWLWCLPLSDKLNDESSCVFEQVGDRDAYVCLLCSRDGDERLRKHSLKDHAGERLHRKRARELLEERDAVLARANLSLRLCGDLKRFRCAELEAGVCRYVFFEDWAALSGAVRRRDLLRDSEPMVLLDLALWKAACELRPPRDVKQVPEWKAWLKHGWKALKGEAGGGEGGDDACGGSPTRHDPLIGITALVAPFLGLKREGR